MRLGLVAEGGGMRAIYTAGILDVFMDEGIRTDAVVGVSAGAIHGCTYLAGQRGRNLRYYQKYCRDPRFIGFRNLLREGNIVGTQFSYVELPQKLDPFDYDAFLHNPAVLYAVCSNLRTGKAEVLPLHDMHSEIDILRASASLPYCSKPVEWNGMLLLDGGCTDSIPLANAERLGYERNIVILTQHEGYVKKPQNKAMIRLFYRGYPEFAKALEKRHVMYNAETEYVRRREKEGEAFVIRPSRPLKIGRMNASPEELQAIYDLGVSDAKARLGSLREWLSRVQEKP